MMAGRTQSPKADPVRTCAGCREQDAQGALLRFAVREEAPRLVPDPRRRLPGRGVSVHPRRVCLERAVKGGGFNRSLRGRVDLDLDELVALVVSRYEARAAGLIGAALRTRRAALGADVTKSAIHDGSASLVVFAKDAAGRRQELSSMAAERGIPVIEHGTKQELGRLSGRPELGVMAIQEERIASELVAVASRAQDISEAE